MIGLIRDAIVKKLKAAFSCSIYTSSVEQGLEEPCFFVLSLTSNQERKLADRHKQTSSFDVHYLPRTDDEEELHGVMSKLFALLEYIETREGLVSCFNIKSEIVDGVLHCFLDYSFRTKRVKEEQVMESHELKGKVNNG